MFVREYKQAKHIFEISLFIEQTLKLVRYHSFNLLNEHKRTLIEFVRELFDRRFVRLQPYTTS